MLELEILDRVEGLYKAFLPPMRQTIDGTTWISSPYSNTNCGGGAMFDDTYAIIGNGTGSWRARWDGVSNLAIGSVAFNWPGGIARELTGANVYCSNYNDSCLYYLNAAATAWTKILTITTFQGFAYEPSTGFLWVKADGNYYKLSNGSLSSGVPVGILGWNTDMPSMYLARTITVPQTTPITLTAGTTIINPGTFPLRYALTRDNSNNNLLVGASAVYTTLLPRWRCAGYNYLADGTFTKFILAVGQTDPTVSGIRCNLYLYDTVAGTIKMLATDLELFGSPTGTNGVNAYDACPLSICAAKIIGTRLVVFIAHTADIRSGAAAYYFTTQISRVEIPYCGS
jgi:hypothetical protein